MTHLPFYEVDKEYLPQQPDEDRMDNTTPITPTFNGNLEHGAAALCDFFLIATQADVPVAKITVVADGKKHKFLVEPGKYKMALLLLYCAVLRQSPAFVFDFDDVLKKLLVPYFSTETVENARLPETSHATLQLLVLGTDVHVSLILKPGYVLPKNPGRTVKKLIEHGWNQHERNSFGSDTPVPLIRQAVREFQKANQSGTIGIIYSWDPKVWPSDKWASRVRLLSRQLGMHGSS